MRVIKAFLLTTWLYSLLLWLYIVARITTKGDLLFDRFIESIPYLTFYTLGMISFALSFISLFIYLAVWGIPGESKTR
jgi:hypothetical protein